jgi:hypothetical protein
VRLFDFRRDQFQVISLLVVLAAFVNLLGAMVTGSVHAYRILPAWFILLALSTASSALKDMKVACWFITVFLCVAVEFLRYREYNTEILFRTSVNYAPLTMFMLMLFSARVEERSTGKEQAYARLKVLRNDSNDRLKELKKIRSGEMEEANAGQAEAIRQKKLTFEVYQEVYPRILRIRYKRDIPPIVQQAAHQAFGLEAGLLYELPEEKGGEVQVRAAWGISEGQASVDEAIAKFASSDLVRVCADTRAPLQPDAIKRQPNLYEEFDAFAETLFPLEFLAPVVVLGKTLFVVIGGRPGKHGRVRFEFNLLQPVLVSSGLAISKLAQKDGRTSFSTFGS